MLRVTIAALALMGCGTFLPQAFSQERTSELHAAVAKLEVGDAVVLEATGDLASACTKLLRTPQTDGPIAVVLQGQVIKIDSATNNVQIKVQQDFPYFGADRKSATETRLLQITLVANLKDFRVARTPISGANDRGDMIPDRLANLPTVRGSSTKGVKLQSLAVIEEIND